MTGTATKHRCEVCSLPATTTDGIVGAHLCDTYDCLLTAWERAAGTPKPPAPEHVRGFARIAYTDREGLGRTEGFNAAADAVWAIALTAAYWKIRQHADAYRATKGYQRAQERWEASGRRDDELMHKLSIHVHYARGIEAAAREVAEMLGIPEHEIEPPANEEKP